MRDRKDDKPFEPFVSIAQIVSFDQNVKETWTESRFLNELLVTLDTIGTASSQRVADHLHLNMAHINGAVKIVTGLSLTRLRALWAIKHVSDRRKAGQKSLMSDSVAASLGYGNRSSLWEVVFAKSNKDLLMAVDPELAATYVKMSSYTNIFLSRYRKKTK